MSRFYPIAFVALVGLLAVGCTRERFPRVVRVSAAGEVPRYELSVNSDVRKVDTNQLWIDIGKLRLKHGDIVIFDQGVFSSAPDRFLSELLSSCDRENVSFYIYDPSDAHSYLTGLYIYHWTTPFDRGRDLISARFFFNGKFFGTGKPGFEAMVKHVHARTRGNVLILGCHVEDQTGSQMIEPFQRFDSELDQALVGPRL